MFSLSDRCELLRDDAVNQKSHAPLMEMQRAYYFIKGICEAPEGKHGDNAYLVASGTASVIRNALALIQDGELIVGHNYGEGEIPECDPELLKKKLKASLFSDAEIDWYITHKAEAENYLQWKGTEAAETKKESELAAELASMGYLITCNHSVIGYEKVLKLGFEGLLEEVTQYEERNGGSFYEPIKLVCEAGCELGEKYAKKAAELLISTENNDQRKAELNKIIETCRQVPRRPARTFLEAVQSLWFAHMINTWEDYINTNSLGRLDQILYPYYKMDIEKGILTKREAFEILCCLWIKLYRDYDVQQSCIGGCTVEGKSAINELSYLMLDVTEALNFIRCLSVRFSADTEKVFVQRALEVVGHVQKGIPFFFNDDVMIPSLTDHGISYEDATDYTQIGCVETVIPGKSNPHAVTSRANLLKAIEYALGNGRSMMNPLLCPGLETGEAEYFKNFEDLKKAVFKQIRHLISSACKMTLRCIPAGAVNMPKPYKSLLTEGCLESGRDFNNQGAKYDYYQLLLIGVPNLADSLAAIRELVYKQKKYTMNELIYQLENDFPDEAVRLDFVNKAPKFGNDIDEVDDLAIEILNFSCDYVKVVSDEYGYDFHPQPFTFLWMVEHGRSTAATPDGRRKGEILAYSVSPMQGRDYNGFTSLVNSLSKLPTKKAPGTTSAIVEVEPILFTDKNIPLFADVLLSGAQKGLCNIQFNVVDADTLIDAQKYPDKHRNLAVRVSGFSQKFYLLDKAVQDHIIGRTKHKYM